MTEFFLQTPSRMKATKALFVSYLFCGQEKKTLPRPSRRRSKRKKARYFCSACEGQPAICPEQHHNFQWEYIVERAFIYFYCAIAHFCKCFVSLSTLPRILCLPFEFCVVMPFLPLLARALLIIRCPLDELVLCSKTFLVKLLNIFFSANRSLPVLSMMS